MTTIAWDGQFMAADTLSTDGWGLREPCMDKIKEGKDFLVGISGNYGQGEKWWRLVEGMSFETVKTIGIPDYDKDKMDPALLLVGREQDGRIGVYRVADGIFYASPFRQCAIGSGRDFALASMYWGKSALEAVECARNFDNNTGMTIIQRALP